MDNYYTQYNQNYGPPYNNQQPQGPPGFYPQPAGYPPQQLDPSQYQQQYPIPPQQQYPPQQPYPPQPEFYNQQQTYTNPQGPTPSPQTPTISLQPSHSPITPEGSTSEKDHLLIPTAHPQNQGQKKNQKIYEGRVRFIASPKAWFKNTEYTITSQYIERESGVCCRSIEHIDLIRVRDISWQSDCCCCQYSTIIVYSTDHTSPKLEIVGIRDGKKLYKQLRDAIQASQAGAILEIES